MGAVHQALRHVLEEVYGLQVHGEAAGEAYALLVAVEAVETDGDLWEEVDSNPQREGRCEEPTGQQRTKATKKSPPVHGNSF